MALGKSDFGLYGVVGSLAVFVGFFNAMLSSAVSRYYAFSIGAVRKLAKEGCYSEGLEDCIKWFNTALAIHLMVPLVLMAIGYPAGVWLIRNFLIIPEARIEVCVTVWQFVTISCFVGMVNVPFSAMYIAKQYIAELTVYSFLQTTANTIFFYYMVTIPRDWLVGYAAWMCFASVIPQIIICIRGCLVFPECKINFRYMWSIDRFKKLGTYAFWQIFGGLGFTFRSQGMSILVNKFFGPTFNSSMSIATQVSGQAQTLAGAMQGAFQPAIVTAFGAGDMEEVGRYAQNASKFALLLTLVFMLPLSIELDFVIKMWLVDPPPCVTGLCLCMFLMLVLDKASIGQSLACNATGRIAAYQATGGSFLILCLPLAWYLLAQHQWFYFVGIAMVISTACNSISRVFFARRLVNLSARRWFSTTIIPVTCVAVISTVFGIVPRMILHESFLRLCLSVAVTFVAFLVATWLVGLNKVERQYLILRVRNVIRPR